MARTTTVAAASQRDSLATGDAESLYLATFLHNLATDNSAPSIASVAAQLLASSSQALEFRDLSILFRDVSAPPQYRPSVRERENVASGVVNGTEGKGCE
jgi:hypothetical protein